MGAAERYRAYAESCQRMADMTPRDDEKRQWLSLAEAWLKAARDYEAEAWLKLGRDYQKAQEPDSTT